jgi:hypothetical protein
METLDIRAPEELARDYTETLRRIVFVLGALDEAAMQVFLDMQSHAPVTIEPGWPSTRLSRSRRGHCG